MHRLLSILTALSIAIALLTAAIYLPATSDGVMLPLMAHFAPPEDTHLPAAEYIPVVDMITAFLRGEAETFQHVFTVDGSQYAAFNQKEQQHMADVQSLFGLCRTIGWISLAATIVLAASLVLLQEKRAFIWFRRPLMAILTMVTVVALLAVIDFNSLFILFHQVAFTNDLWLLNPSTDLLIRLMPIEFFISYAAIIGGAWLCGMSVAIVGSILLQRLIPKE